MIDDAVLFQLGEQAVCTIGTIIVIKQKVGDADNAVEGDPFQEERAFVLDASEGCDAHYTHPDLLPEISNMGCPPILCRAFLAFWHLIVSKNYAICLIRRQSLPAHPEKTV
jgi:hypothetical protein